MRISLKTIIWLWLGLLLMVGVMLYSAYTRLKPEVFLESLNIEVQRNFPGAVLVVADTQYKFSVDLNFVLQQLTLSHQGQELLTLGELEVRVPWWLVLFNKGNAQINLTDLMVMIDGPEIKNKVAQASNSKSSKKLSVSLPEFLSDAQYTLRAKNVSIKNRESSRNYFTLSKLLVREFQFGKNSAFEMNVPIKITHPGANFNSELWLFGDLTPEKDIWNINFRGEFRTRETADKAQIDDLIIDGKAVFDVAALQIQSTIDLLIERQTVGKGTIIANADAMTVQTELNAIPVNFLTIIDNKSLNPYWSNLTGAASGTVKFIRPFIRGKSSLKGKIAFDGSISLLPQNELPGKWQISFEDARWESSFISPQGEISYFRRSHVDFSKGEVTQFAQELGFSGLEISSPSQPLISLGQLMKMTPEAYFNSTIAYKNCTWGDKLMDGTFRLGITPDQRFYTGELQTGKSSLKMNYLMKGNSEQLDLTFKDFSWPGGLGLLEPYFGAASAVLDGKIQGQWSTNESLAGTWYAKFSGKNLQELTGSMPQLNNRLKAFFGLMIQPADDQEWEINIKNNILVINKILIQGQEIVQLNGQLAADVDDELKSWLTMSYPKNKKRKADRKEVDVNFWKEAL